MRLVRQAWLLTRSELRQELRDRELLLTAGFFSLLMLAMFGLSFSALPRGDALRAAVPGMLWLSVAFVGSLTLTRIFDREREADTLRALLAAPVERLAVYLAKAVITLVVLVICCAVLIPGLMLLFEPARVMLEAPLQTAAIVVLGSLGFVAVGALFAAGLASGSGKNVLVELPWHYSIDDAMYYNFGWLESVNLAQKLSDPDRVLEMWWAGFRHQYLRGGYYNVVLHPFISGRALRIDMLDRLITRMKTLPGVWFPSCEDVARHCLAHYPPQKDTLA